MRKKRPIQRTEGLKRDASLVVIASEDKYAVKQYFELFHSTRIQFRVLETNQGMSAPQHVMKRLTDFMDEYNFGDGDQFWLVCDTDHWIESNHIQNLVEVVKLCRQKGIGVALTNPCFDLWLLLHYCEFPNESELKCGDLGKMIRTAVGEYDKRRIYNLPISSEAVLEAIDRSKNNFSDSNDIPSQPQTAVHLILDELIAHGFITVRR